MGVNEIQFLKHKNIRLRKFFAPFGWERCLSLRWDGKLLFQWSIIVKNGVKSSLITKSINIQMVGNMINIQRHMDNPGIRIQGIQGGRRKFLPLIIRSKELEIRDNYLFLAFLPLLKGKRCAVLYS